jgi:hypothetical protein
MSALAMDVGADGAALPSFSQDSARLTVAADAGPGHHGSVVAPDDLGMALDGPMPPSLGGASGSLAFPSSSSSGRGSRVRRSCYACGTTVTGLWFDAAGKSYSALKAPTDPAAKLFCDATACRHAGATGRPRLCNAGHL